MALNGYKILTGNSTSSLERKVLDHAAVFPHMELCGPPSWHEGTRLWVQAVLTHGKQPPMMLTQTDLNAFAPVDLAAAVAAPGIVEVAEPTPPPDDMGMMTPVGYISAAAREFLKQPHYTAMRILIDLGKLAEKDQVTNAEVAENAGIDASKITVAAGAGNIASADLQAFLTRLDERISALE